MPTEVTINLEQPNDRRKKVSGLWWTKKGAELVEEIGATVEVLKDAAQARHSRDLAHARLYSNRHVEALTSWKYSVAKKAATLTLNLSKSMISTLKSKITKNRPRAMFLTEGGGHEDKDKAKLLNKYSFGLTHEMSLYDLGPKIFVDALIFGVGCIHQFASPDTGRPTAERVFIGEILVPEEECFNTDKPRQMHRVRTMNAQVAQSSWQKFAKQIELATRRNQEHKGGDNSLPSNEVEVRQSWHLPSFDVKAERKRAKKENRKPRPHDGRYVITIDGVDDPIVDIPWEKSYFPFNFYRWDDGIAGFYSAGLNEEIIGLQREVNKLLKKIASFMNGNAPHVFVERGSNINESEISNEIWSIIEYDRQPPKFGTFASVPAEFFHHLERLVRQAYEIAGISQLSAQSQKPGGLDSGKALDTFNDIETERFHDAGRSYENFFMGAIEMGIDLSRDIYLKDPSVAVFAENTTRGNKFLERIDWKKIDLDADQYVMKVFPISLLPSTPSGKLAYVERIVDKFPEMRPYALEMLDFPDVESFTNLLSSQVNVLDQQITNMLKHGIQEFPEPRTANLQFAATHMWAAYNRARLDKYPLDAQNRLLRYLEAIRRLDQMAQQAAAPPPAPPQAAPGPGLPPGAPQAAPPQLPPDAALAA